MNVKQKKIKEINKKILYLKKNILSVDDVLKSLHNIATDVPVVIVTCGPSLNSIPKDKIIALSSSCILIAVKQAHQYLDGMESIHLINQYNLMSYHYKKNKTYVISSFNEFNNKYKIYSKVDLVLPHDDSVFRLDNADMLKKRLVVTGKFDEYLLCKNYKRPWGPGIVLELAIYLAIHLGSKDIYLIGYDLASPSDDVPYFKKFYGEKKYFEINKSVSNIIYRFGRKMGISEEKIKYSIGLLYNPAGPMDIDENKLLVESSDKMYRWIQSLGANLYLCSDRSYISELIPRVSIDEISSYINK
jgi:hypothetical protein